MDNEETPAVELGAPQAKAHLARRNLLAAGIGGVAASLLPSLMGRAGASTPDDSGGGGSGGSGPDETSPDASTENTTDDTGGINADGGITGITEDSAGGPSTSAAPATTTSVSPQRPTDADVDRLDFLQGAEIAARELYDIALKSPALSEDQRLVLTAIGQAHRSYGQSLSGLLGREASNTANDELFSSMSSSFGGPVDGVIAAAYDLENSLVATHLDVIGQLEGTDAIELLAAVVTIEGRHGVVLADMAGTTELDDLLVAEEADAMAPAEG